MIVDERLTTYINSLASPNSELLDQIEREALASQVPIIRKEMQGFFKWLLAMKRPKRILEVGTAVGFSALLMAENTSPECRITTIENYDRRIPAALANFRRAEMEERITLLEGDAAEILPSLQGSFELIFMDAAKGQYIHFLPDIMRLLAADGVLVSDNVLQDGDIIESHYAVTRRNRTIYKRMREYLYTLTHHPELATAVLPVGDGITVSTRTERGAGGTEQGAGETEQGAEKTEQEAGATEQGIEETEAEAGGTEQENGGTGQVAGEAEAEER